MSFYCKKCKIDCKYEKENKIVSCDEVDFDEKTQISKRFKGELHSCLWIPMLNKNE